MNNIEFLFANHMLKNGWHEGRCYSELDSLIKFLGDKGFVVHGKAREILQEFGGLVLPNFQDKLARFIFLNNSVLQRMLRFSWFRRDGLVVNRFFATMSIEACLVGFVCCRDCSCHPIFCDLEGKVYGPFQIEGYMYINSSLPHFLELWNSPTCMKWDSEFTQNLIGFDEIDERYSENSSEFNNMQLQYVEPFFSLKLFRKLF